jgi:hypothetical protein
MIARVPATYPQPCGHFAHSTRIFSRSRVHLCAAVSSCLESLLPLFDVLLVADAPSS